MRDKGDYILQHRSYDHAVSLMDTMTIDVVRNIFITPRIYLSESEDKSKVVLYRDINNGMHLSSYDLNTRSILWENEFEFTAGNLHRDYSSMEISNEGDFYLVLEPDKFLQKVQQLEVISSSFATGVLRQQTIDLGDY